MHNNTLLSYTLIFRRQFYFVISNLKITGPGYPYNNLELLYKVGTLWIGFVWLGIGISSGLFETLGLMQGGGFASAGQ
jgi:hypothetical protein